MNMRRGPGGVPEYVPTTPRKTPSAAPGGPDVRPHPGLDATVPDTRPIDRTGETAGATDFIDRRGRDAGKAERTRIHRGDRSPAPGSDTRAQPADRGPGGGVDPMADPPAGWLVIVDGPGKGRAVTLGLHHNPIGRDAESRVVLDYGDDTISRSRHLVVTYDPEGRRFWVTPGDGTNLCYVNDQPVLASMPLEPCARIRTGRTTLRFVPLCGPDFSWDGGGDADAGGGDV